MIPASATARSVLTQTPLSPGTTEGPSISPCFASGLWPRPTTVKSLLWGRRAPTVAPCWVSDRDLGSLPRGHLLREGASRRPLRALSAPECSLKLFEVALPPPPPSQAGAGYVPLCLAFSLSSPFLAFSTPALKYTLHENQGSKTENFAPPHL